MFCLAARSDKLTKMAAGYVKVSDVPSRLSLKFRHKR